MNDAPIQVQFVLISHTNNGKTTLARTLTGIDVGEVRDAAHVTTTADSHLLLASPAGDELRLWDTPGFGDSIRLKKRLALSGNPIGWILREVFDRYRDRPFWLSQQALRAAKESADVVLYLVNASESPRDAGYLAAEMNILEWLGKPVAVLLNQMGPPKPHREEEAERTRWQEHLAQYPIVKSVLALDAFARSWVHEHVFYQAIASLIEPAKLDGYQRIVSAWREQNARRFERAVHAMALQLAAAAGERQLVAIEQRGPMKSAFTLLTKGKSAIDQRQSKAMATLIERLEFGIEKTTVELLSLYRIDPGKATVINARVRDNFVVKAPLDKAQAGLIGAIMSGAATGFSADLMAGGLTLGGGALIGSIVGALTFAGAAWGFNATTNRDQTTIQLSDEFLLTLTASTILRYLAIIHFGRGRGNYVESEAPPFWQEPVNVGIVAHADELKAVWKEIRVDPDLQAALGSLENTLRRLIEETISRLYAHIDLKLYLRGSPKS